MCGIAGFISNRDGALLPLGRVNELLKHRGPDDSGQWLHPKGHVGFAHTRLSILDLSPSGHQPMVDPLSGNVIIFNGEIYNHLEVRAEIERVTGPILWLSTSDTETLLAAFRIWSIGCLRHLRGMFAFAVWEEKEQRLWLARDRLGIKPLYYHEKRGMLEFASEAGVLVKAGNLDFQLSPDGLRHYARFGCAHDDVPLLQGLYSLRAGHWLCCEKGRIFAESYWEPDVSPLAVGATEAKERVKAEFERAVREHLLADVEVSAFLSGGMDSAAISAVAAGAMGARLHSFTVVFPGSELDEGPEARAMAERLGTNHHEVRLSRDEVLAGVGGTLDAMDLPTIDGVNSFLVAGATRRAGLKVALSGLGGDELFGGYRHFRTIPWLLRSAWLWRRLPSAWMELALRLRLSRRHARERAQGLRMPDIDAAEMVAWYRSLWSPSTLSRMGFAGEDRGSDRLMRRRDYTARISWTELTGYLRMMLLRDADVFGMAHGLEIRVPFLDHQLVELLLRLPERVKTAGNRPKPLLAAILDDQGLLPLIPTRKRGFVLPFEKWMKGELCELVEKGLQAARAEPCLAKMDWKALRNDFERGRLHWSRLWQWVVLGHWLRKYR
jgi:asparagine synthase (glutamine-hydrolysing)